MNSDKTGPTITPLKRVELNGLFGDRNVQFELTSEPVTLLFGQNGAGKSTALRVVSQMLGPNIDSLPQEPVQGATLTFEGGASMTFVAGAPATWREHFADGTSNEDQLADPASFDGHPDFVRYVERETPYSYRDGKVWAPGWGGRAAPEAIMNQIRAGYRRWSQQRRVDVGAPASDRRLLKRDCFLITSDRLVTPESRGGFDGFHPRFVMGTKGAPVDSDVVERISLELRELIRDSRQEYSKQSWKLDGSFITRAAETLKSRAPLSDEDRGKLVHQISELQGRLVTCALATSQADIPQFPSDSPEVKVILDLYLSDLLEKAQASLVVLRRLEIFEAILNAHFTDKDARLRVESGLTIRRRKNDAPIPLDRLSSGERHLIVLFHHLIFKAQPGGICLIDEPEISLHIDWQERFIDSVAKVAAVSPQQYLIATHSPSIVGNHHELMRDIRGEPLP